MVCMYTYPPDTSQPARDGGNFADEELREWHVVLF